MDRSDPTPHEHDAVAGEPGRVAMTCYRHPDTPTRLRCSECDKPICVNCMHDSAVGQRCPECARPQGRNRVVTVRTMQQTSWQSTPVTFGLLAINVLLFLVVGTSFASQVDWFVLDVGVLANGDIIGVRAGEWWRVITGTFLHGSITHILFNMYALYVLGPQLERQAGSSAFAGLYFASAIGGSLASILLGTSGPSVGASGAIFGLFGAWLWAGWRMRHTPGGRALLNQFSIIILINAALPLFLPIIDWRAHLGGLLVGIGVAAAWSQFASGKRNATAIRTVIGFGLAAFGLLVAILL